MNFLKGRAGQRAWQLQHTSGTGLPHEQPAASIPAATWPAGAIGNAQPSVSNTLSSPDALSQGKDGSGCSKTGAGTAEGVRDSPSNDAALSLLLSRLRAQRGNSSLENAAARPALGLEPVSAAHVQLPYFRACSSSFQEQVEPASMVSQRSSRESDGRMAAAADADAPLPTTSASWGQQTSHRTESIEPGASMHQPAGLQRLSDVSMAPDQTGMGPQAGQVAAECHILQHEQTAVQGDLSELLYRLQESKAHQQRQRGAGFTPQVATFPSGDTQTRSAHIQPRHQEISRASSMGADAEQIEGNGIHCWSHSPPSADQCGPEPGTWQLACSAGKQHSKATAAAWELERRLQQSRDKGTAASMGAASSNAVSVPQDTASSSGARVHQQGSNVSGVAHLPGLEWYYSRLGPGGEAVNVAERLRGWTSRPRPAAANPAVEASATAAETGGTGASVTNDDRETAEPQGGCSKDEARGSASAACSLRTGQADTLPKAATEATQKAVPSMEADVHPQDNSEPWTLPR